MSLHDIFSCIAIGLIFTRLLGIVNDMLEASKDLKYKPEQIVLYLAIILLINFSLGFILIEGYKAIQ